MKDNKEKQDILIKYGMYCNFIKEIKHFDNLQTQFRLIASTVLLGSIAAVGFLFSIDSLKVPFERSYAALIVAAMGISSLYTLWRVDLKFYEKLLASNFAEAYRLEKENAWVPKVHHNMLLGSHKKDHPSNVAYYYIGCILTLILIIGLVFAYYLYSFHNYILMPIITLVLMVLMMFIFSYLIKKKTEKLEELLIKLNYIEKK